VKAEPVLSGRPSVVAERLPPRKRRCILLLRGKWTVKDGSFVPIDDITSTDLNACKLAKRVVNPVLQAVAAEDRYWRVSS